MVTVPSACWLSSGTVPLHRGAGGGGCGSVLLGPSSTVTPAPDEGTWGSRHRAARHLTSVQAGGDKADGHRSSTQGAVLVGVQVHRHPVCHHAARASPGYLCTVRQSLQGKRIAPHPMAALPLPTCLFKHTWGRPPPPVTQGGFCLFPGARPLQFRGLLTTPHWSPLLTAPQPTCHLA